MKRPWIFMLTLFAALAIVRTSPAAEQDAEDDHEASQQRMSSYERHALTKRGDPKRGRELFFDEQRTKCSTCHRVEKQGGAVGPELTHIGGKFDRPHLIESLIEPSRQIVEGFRTTKVLTVDGTIYSGIVKEQSDESITLLDAHGDRQTLDRIEIEEVIDSSVSIMPDGLEKMLSPAEFTDLIAWLESLRPAGNKMGAGIAGPLELPEGFEVRTVATGLSGATALEVLPDGRVLICEQTGAVRVVENGELLDQPMVTLPVEAYWERGVIGVTCHPQFPRVPHIFVCWIAKEPYPHHRVSRFTVEGNAVVAHSEQVLLTGDDQTKMGGSVPAGHQGGGLHFGPDGKLYIGIGEQTAGRPAQKLDTFLGKLLRINPDGSVPEDNPFFSQAQGKYRAIWARGCRNPFTFAVRPSDGLMLINDVGGKSEEINVGLAGANYGWPVVEHGDEEAYQRDDYQGPIYWYPQSSINGADFSPGGLNWPNDWQERYFFADFIQGWIKTLDPENPKDVETFGTGFRRPVDLRFAPDGSLYVLLRNAWVIDDRFQPGTGSLLQIRPAGGRAEAAGRRRVTLTENAIDESAGGLTAYKIETPRATYFLEKSGAGLSSMVDLDGNDWIGFHPAPDSGAGGEFRGFPNAVYKAAGSYFHPRNAGTDPSATEVELVSEDLVRIRVESDNKLWAGRYEFSPTSCTFTITRMPKDKSYWVLYEGTPGGQYDDDDWWMTSAISDHRPLTTPHNGDIPAPEWIAFGDQSLNRVLYMYHHSDDEHPDTFYQMQQKMTVFGFGRRGLERFLDSAPQRFSIGFVESTDHQTVGHEIQRK